MNFYKVVGQITAKTSKFLTNIGFKNIKSISTMWSDSVEITTKNNLVAQIRYNSPGVRGVYWSIDDIKGRAKERWDLHKEDYPKAIGWEDVYDETLFMDCLHLMIAKHDANIGISWDTIDFWLDEVCLIKKK